METVGVTPLVILKMTSLITNIKNEFCGLICRLDNNKKPVNVITRIQQTKQTEKTFQKKFQIHSTMSSISCTWNCRSLFFTHTHIHIYIESIQNMAEMASLISKQNSSKKLNKNEEYYIMLQRINSSKNNNAKYVHA